MKNSEITAAFINLGNIINQNEKLPVRLSYAITRNIRALEPLNKAFEEERNKLLDMYNVKDADGRPEYVKTNKIEIAEEYKAAWEKEIRELLNIDTEFKPHRIHPSDLPENIEPGVLLALDFMIID